ncbi:MAG: Gfo/Idh/MocA family protein [Promethearchaeota archaeon]
MKFGIIGFGIFAEKRLVPGFKKSRAEILSITKRNIEQAKEKAKLHGIKKYHDDPELLLKDDEIDAVFIASPNKLHFEHVLLAAEHGKHVICEKPVAMNVKEARKMQEACQKHGVKFMVAQCFRYAGSTMKIKEIIDSGVLGEINFISATYTFNAEKSQRKWVFDKKLAGGGPSFDVGIHMIDLIRFLNLKQEVVSFNGLMKEYNQELFPNRTVESSASLMLKFSNEVQGHVRCSFELPYLTQIQVFGSERFLVSRYFTRVNEDAEILVYSDKKLNVPEERIKINNGDFYAREIDAFISEIENPGNDPAFPSGIDGIINQTILDHWRSGLDHEEMKRIINQ